MAFIGKIADPDTPLDDVIGQLEALPIQDTSGCGHPERPKCWGRYLIMERGGGKVHRVPFHPPVWILN